MSCLLFNEAVGSNPIEVGPVGVDSPTLPFPALGLDREH
jgi:hypothetical protein